MKLRMKICLDAARGLHYLHTRTPVVIHRDIKSGNVLLDAQMNAKLSDFGLAKLKYVVSLWFRFTRSRSLMIFAKVSTLRYARPERQHCAAQLERHTQLRTSRDSSLGCA